MRLRRQRRKILFAQVPDALIRDLSVSGEAVRLWALLDRYAGANDVAWPGQERLAEDLGRSVETVRRDLKSLRAAGWLQYERDVDDRGYWRGNLYTLIEDQDLPSDPIIQESPANQDRASVTGAPGMGDRLDRAPVTGHMKESQEKEKNYPPSPHGGEQLMVEVEAVFTAWVESTTLCGLPRMRATLTAVRRKLIRDRLRDGYDMDTLIAAVRGWRWSAHHRGENESGTVYNGLEHCLSIGERGRAANLERFAAMERGDLPADPRSEKYPRKIDPRGGMKAAEAAVKAQDATEVQPVDPALIHEGAARVLSALRGGLPQTSSTDQTA